MKRNGGQRPSNISARLQITQFTSCIISKNCSERIQLIDNDINIGTKSSCFLQHLISDPIYGIHNPHNLLKGFLRFLLCSGHFLLKAFQIIDLAILLLSENNMIRFECTTHLNRISRSLLPMFTSHRKNCYGGYFSFHTLLHFFPKIKKLYFSEVQIPLCHESSPNSVSLPRCRSFFFLIDFGIEIGVFQSGLLMEARPVEMAFWRLFLMLACHIHVYITQIRSIGRDSGLIIRVWINPQPNRRQISVQASPQLFVSLFIPVS